MLSEKMEIKMKALLSASAAVLIASSALSGCSTAEVRTQGYVIDQRSVDLVPVGSSREQVELSLGTPSTTGTFNEEEAYYYISQKRVRPIAFLNTRVVEQNILAVYFANDGTVSRLANYTLQDGRVFDLISRTTPTGGNEETFLGQVLTGGPKPFNPFSQ